MTYGRIIVFGSFFMIIYSGLSQIIRADGSPKYSMICLLVGAILNIILDPIFIFTFNMGVAGGAIATVIGQIVSFVIAIFYIPKIKSVKISKEDFKIGKCTLKTLSLGLSSFITQMTVFALFVVMNNIMNKYALTSKFGKDIPLSVYGVISKINSLYVSLILGLAIGAQPIIGFNYGAGNYKRVKETLRKVMVTGFIIGIIFNLCIYIFPEKIVSIFINKSSDDYKLFMEFAIDFCRIFLLVCALNSFEMCSSITIQSLGNVKKATMVSFAIQIVFTSEYKKITRLENIKAKNEIIYNNENLKPVLNKRVVVAISREYGSGGRYVGEIISKKLGIKFYDKAFIIEVNKETGLSEEFIKENEQKHRVLGSFEYNNDDKLFIAEEKVIKNISKESCVIVGRCASYVLKDNKDTVKIFLYSSEEDKIKRAIKYYNIPKNKAKKEIEKINKMRDKHYSYYTGSSLYNPSNYDLMINVDSLGVEGTADYIIEYIMQKK